MEVLANVVELKTAGPIGSRSVKTPVKARQTKSIDFSAATEARVYAQRDLAVKLTPEETLTENGSNRGGVAAGKLKRRPCIHIGVDLGPSVVEIQTGILDSNGIAHHDAAA